MPREARQAAASGTYHIMNRGNDRRYIFMDDADNIKFLSLLSDIQDDSFKIIAYCLMGNHYHLLVHISDQKSTEILESKMKSLMIRYTAYFNRRYARTGVLVQGRYKSQPIESVSFFCRVLRYIHRNPVAAGMRAEMADYPWSSYCEYFGPGKSLCPICMDYALQLHPLAWWAEWHKSRDQNSCGIIDDGETSYPLDSVLRAAFANMGLPCDIGQIEQLPVCEQRRIVRRLCREEGGKAVQVARLTGLPKGVVNRYLF